MVHDYMLSKGIPESLLANVKIKLLVSRNRDMSTLSFVSFKIDVSREVADIITRMYFWPANCTLKNFIHKTKPIVNISEVMNNSNFPRIAQHLAMVRQTAGLGEQ